MPQPLYPQGWPITHHIGGWVDPRAGLDGKILPPPGFDPRAVQPMVSCYTN